MSDVSLTNKGPVLVNDMYIVNYIGLTPNKISSLVRKT